MEVCWKALKSPMSEDLGNLQFDGLEEARGRCAASARLSIRVL